jgi:protein-S-isoprenylcysteine O-methyltransferase Ste14
VTRLTVQAFGGLGFLLVAMAAGLFLPVWTLYYWQAWVFLAVFGGSVIAVTVYLVRNDRALLERRVHAGPVAEKRRRQQLIQAIANVAFIAVIVVPPIDRRLGWSAVPTPVAIAGDVLVAFGVWVVFRVFRANTFTSAIIEVDRDQRVISTGPYSIVRHPMYAGAIVMLIGVPLALGSWWGLIAVVPMVLVVAWRLLDEEAFLAKQLAGYTEYCSKVRYRLVPFIW